MAKRIRAFVAVELPPDLRRRAARLQGKLAESGAGVRWVREENIHLTMKFLGEIEELHIPPVCRAVQQSAQAVGNFTLEVRGLGAFPSLRRPRTLWLGIATGAEQLTLVYDLLEAALEEIGFRPEPRRFTPHITIGRMRNSRDAPKLASGAEGHADWPGGEVLVREIVVMTSQLTPQGPNYSVVGRGKLKS